MSKTVQVRMPEELKNEVSFILSEVGLTPSDAINMFYKQIVLHNGIPFDVRIPNKTTVAAIEEAKRGKLPKYDNVETLFEDIMNEEGNTY